MVNPFKYIISSDFGYFLEHQMNFYPQVSKYKQLAYIKMYILKRTWNIHRWLLRLYENHNQEKRKILDKRSELNTIIHIDEFFKYIDEEHWRKRLMKEIHEDNAYLDKRIKEYEALLSN